MARVTIQDVANYAQVSQATVSRVLNDNPTVDAELRERVLDAVRKLGYQPSRAARRLRKASHDVIGLIVSDIQNPHFVSVIKGVEEAAYVNEMNVLLCNTGEDSQRLRKYLLVMRAESVAGLIVVPTDDEDAALLHDLQEENIPVVVLDRSIAGFEADTVQSDNEGGACTATTHLIQLGYRRIGFIQPDVVTGYERRQGYLNALNKHDIPADEALIRVGGHRVDDSYRLALELLSLPQPPQAIFTATNLMTLGVLRALRERGVRIPDDMALVGFDDLPWIDELYVPFTAVAQPTHEIGQEAVRVLLRRLQNPDAPYEDRRLQPTLIVRASCGSHLAS